MRRVLDRFSTVNKALKYYKINSLFFKLFLSIIIVSLLIAILSASAFIYFKSVLTEREIRTQEVYLENNSLYLDNVIKRMEDSIYFIRNDNDLILGCRRNIRQ
jgi:hypothetical protein